MNFEVTTDNIGAQSMGILGFSLHEKIADYLWRNGYDEISGWSKKQLVNMSKAILPVYQAGLGAGLPLYVYNNEQSRPILGYVSERVNFSLVDINTYLMLLEEMAKSGLIEYKHYDPQTTTKTQTTFSLPSVADVGEVTKDVFSAVGEEMDKQWNKILIVGAVVATIALVARPWARAKAA